MKSSIRAMLDAAIADGDLSTAELASYLDTQAAAIPTVAEALATLRANNAYTATTLKLYEPHWQRLVDAFGDRPVDRVKPVELADLGTAVLHAAARGDAGPAGHINDGARAHLSFHSAARALWADAYRRLNLLPASSPAHRDPLPRRHRNPRRRGLTDPELLETFDIIEARSWDPALHVLLVRALLESGARRTALKHATIGDLDLARSTITRVTKYGAVVELLLSPATVAGLLDLAAARGSTRPEDPLLVNKSGSPANDHTFDRLFAMLRRHSPRLRRLGLSAHHFRHSHGTRLERAGSAAIAAASLGHAERSTTDGYTSATHPEVVRAWVTVFDDHPLLHDDDAVDDTNP